MGNKNFSDKVLANIIKIRNERRIKQIDIAAVLDVHLQQKLKAAKVDIFLMPQRRFEKSFLSHEFTFGKNASLSSLIYTNFFV